MSKIRLTIAVSMGLAGALFLLYLMSGAPLRVGATPLSQDPTTIVPIITTIQAAINIANDGDVVSIPGSAYMESLTIDKDITLRGVSSNATIIQAATGQRVITVTSGHSLRVEKLSVIGGRTNAAGGAIYVDNGSLTIVDCVIADNWASYGGGIYQGNAGKVDIIGSRIERNHADIDGGGLFITGNATLTDTLVLTNTATRDGGGLTDWTGRVSILRGTVAGNKADRNGGGINLNNDISVYSTQVISNTAGQDGGGILQWNGGYEVIVVGGLFERNRSFRDGGGLWARGNTTVTTSEFTSNKADSRSSTNTNGGGLYAFGGTLLITSSTFRANQVNCTGCSFTYGGGLNVDSPLPVTIQDSLFEANYGWFGGGLRSAQAITIKKTTFKNNSAGYGGGAYVVDGDIQSTDFIGNHAVNKGGGLEAIGKTKLAGAWISNGSAMYGGGLYLPVAAHADLVNVVIADNTAYYIGSGLLAEAATMHATQTTIARNIGGERSGVCLARNPSGVLGSTAVMTNTILVNQTVGISATLLSTASLKGVLWFSNTANTGGAGSVAVSSAVIGTPAFASDGYHLTAASKAIDQGINSGVTTDIDGDPRPWGKGFDLGADEFIPRIYVPMLRR